MVLFFIKRKGRSCVFEVVFVLFVSGLWVFVKEFLLKRVLDFSLVIKGVVVESGEEVVWVVFCEFLVKSSLLLLEIKFEYKRGLFFNYFDGWVEGGWSKELGRVVGVFGVFDVDGLKFRNYFGVGRLMVIIKVIFFVKFKYVELNFKIFKNFDSLGNEYNLFS